MASISLLIDSSSTVVFWTPFVHLVIQLTAREGIQSFFLTGIERYYVSVPTPRFPGWAALAPSVSLRARLYVPSALLSGLDWFICLFSRSPRLYRCQCSTYSE